MLNRETEEEVEVVEENKDEWEEEKRREEDGGGLEGVERDRDRDEVISISSGFWEVLFSFLCGFERNQMDNIKSEVGFSNSEFYLRRFSLSQDRYTILHQYSFIILLS